MGIPRFFSRLESVKVEVGVLLRRCLMEDLVALDLPSCLTASRSRLLDLIGRPDADGDQRRQEDARNSSERHIHHQATMGETGNRGGRSGGAGCGDSDCSIENLAACIYTLSKIDFVGSSLYGLSYSGERWGDPLERMGRLIAE